MILFSLAQLLRTLTALKFVDTKPYIFLPESLRNILPLHLGLFFQYQSDWDFLKIFQGY
jgi:hypothetical protein